MTAVFGRGERSGATDEAVTAAFEGLRDEKGDEAAVDRAEAALSATLDEPFGPMAAGVERADEIRETVEKQRF
ncbi:hypothetical protein [Halorientalis sp.]|uniref:hypothetical protein n=1 Tax=Halorientalis sp. TaxID=1931229 RepID=UPI002628AF7B|nr:hypothetical protein [Halorientalis sp.]